MPQVAWPTRHVHCSTLSGGASKFFTVSEDHRHALAIGSAATFVHGGVSQTRYIFVPPDPSPAEFHDYVLATDSRGRNIMDTVPGEFTLEVDVGLVTNYPTRPMLKDPGVQSRATVSNPLEVKTWTQGFGRYEGSVTFEVGHAADVPIAEAFIDQLHDPDAWFELPLPGEHLGLNNVVGYNHASGEITLDVSSSGNAALQDRYVHGWFGRVGARTVRVTSSRQQLSFLFITVTPSGLITGTTAQAQSNSFSGVKTCRVRAEQVTAVGSADFGAVWTIDWAETNRTN